MLGLLVLLLFGVTGFTINHEDWFGATTPRVTETEGRTPLSLVTKKDALRIVEHLRATFRISGAMTDYDDASDRVMIAFKEPGRTWEVQIEKVTGATKIHEEAFNFAAIINDL